MRQMTRTVLGATLAIALCQPALAAWPEDKPIEIVVGFVAGGGTDVMARKLVPYMEKRLGGKAKFVVINKPGAAGEIASTAVARVRALACPRPVMNPDTPPPPPSPNPPSERCRSTTPIRASTMIR